MATCKGCGKTIIWGRNEQGTLIPLDPVAPTFESQDPEYNINGVLDQLPPGSAVPVRRSPAMVSHFATCPQAAKFSHRAARSEAV